VLGERSRWGHGGGVGGWQGGVGIVERLSRHGLKLLGGQLVDVDVDTAARHFLFTAEGETLQ
jgi:hypothetical protein